MRDTTGLNTPYVISSLHTTRPPMSEARRRQVHGPLLPARPEGELSIRAGAGLLGLIAVGATLLAILIP